MGALTIRGSSPMVTTPSSVPTTPTGNNTRKGSSRRISPFDTGSSVMATRCVRFGISYEIADELHRHRVSSGDSLFGGEHD